MDVKVLLLGLLDKQYKTRLSAEQALKNKWLASKTEIVMQEKAM